MNTRKLGKKIKLARVACDLTQEELGQKVQAFQKTISLYEAGRSLPPLDVFLKLTKVLKKSPSHFLDELS